MLGCQWHRFQRSTLVRTTECLRQSESWPVALEVSVGLTVRGGMLGASPGSGWLDVGDEVDSLTVRASCAKR